MSNKFTPAEKQAIINARIDRPSHSQRGLAKFLYGGNSYGQAGYVLNGRTLASIYSAIRQCDAKQKSSASPSKKASRKNKFVDRGVPAVSDIY